MSNPGPRLLRTRTPPDAAALLATKKFILDAGKPLNVDLILYYFGKSVLGDPLNLTVAWRVYIPEPSPYKPRILVNLHEIMNKPVSYKTLKTETKTHVGSPDNQAYRPWRVIAKQVDGISVDSKPKIQAAIMLLDFALYGVVNIWPFPDVPLITEADFAERFYIDVLKPCARAINLLLRLWYMIYKDGESPPVVSVRPERYFYAADDDDPALRAAKMFVDHVVVCTRAPRSLDEEPEETVLVLSEEKKPGSIKIEDLGPFTKPDGEIIENASFNMSHHMAQSLKYVQRHKCSFSTLCNGQKFVGMNWFNLDQTKGGVTRSQSISRIH